MIAGDTFLRAGRHVKTDPHLWIVISDPAKDRAYLVAANVTSQRIDKDQSCVEHDFISRESVVLYSAQESSPSRQS